MKIEDFTIYLKRGLAALMFFTRLPFWRITNVPAEHFKRVVPLWPLAGWLTGGIMTGVLWIGAQFFPVSVAWILAIISRLLVTGCLHEDGLADFCDGFGGGTTREKVLSIMKDSHIGTYGVIGLIIYFLLFTQAPAIRLPILIKIVIVGDAWSKMCAAHIINFLPYCRNAEEAKIHTIYERMTSKEWGACIVFGLLPAILFLPYELYPALLAPMAVTALLILLMKRRISGYTGDCCGATFLMSELSFFLVSLAIVYNYYL